jgi:drug/metabolite transporter (DMT)-like permease
VTVSQDRERIAADAALAGPAEDTAPAGAALRGIALMVFGTVVFAVMNALVKWLGADYTTIQLVFFRNFFALLPVLFLLCRARSLRGLATRRPFAHLRRSVIGLISLGAFFYAYAHMPIADVTAIAFTAPLFVTALSVPLLGEAVGLRRWSAVIVGFAGVLVMLRPGGDGFDSVTLIALGAAFLYALVMIYVREMSHTESPTAIVFYYLVSSSVLVAVALPFFWVSPDPEGWLLLFALGLVGGIGQLVMTTAFR